MNWTFILKRKPAEIIVAIPEVLAFTAVLAILVIVGLVLTGSLGMMAALREKSRKKRELSNRYMLPERMLISGELIRVESTH